MLAACGETGSEPRSAAPPPSDRPTHNTPSPPGAPVPRDGASRVAPRRGLIDVRPVPFERVRLDEGGRALTVFYYGGVEACYGLDRVDVALAPRTVAVTVYEGRVPGAQVCAEVLQRKATTVRLQEPVAGRRIVDGARRK